MKMQPSASHQKEGDELNSSGFGNIAGFRKTRGDGEEMQSINLMNSTNPRRDVTSTDGMTHGRINLGDQNATLSIANQSPVSTGLMNKTLQNTRQSILKNGSASKLAVTKQPSEGPGSLMTSASKTAFRQDESNVDR